MKTWLRSDIILSDKYRWSVSIDSVVLYIRCNTQAALHAFYNLADDSC